MQSLAAIRLENPLGKRVVDEKALKAIFAEYNVVPYTGRGVRTGHRELLTLWELYETTTSFAACTQGIAGYAFGGDIEIVNSRIEGLKPQKDSPEVPYATQVSYAQALESVGVKLSDIIQITEEQLFPSFQLSGNVFLRYEEITVGGEKKLIIKRIHETQVLFLYDPNGDNPTNERSILVVPELDEKAIKEGKGEILRIYPFMDVESNGDRRTVFCLKNTQTAGDWWGRGVAQHVLPEMLIEKLHSDLGCKTMSVEFVAKYIYKMQQAPAYSEKGGDDEVADSLADAIAMLRKTTTNKGTYSEQKGIGVLSYPNELDTPVLDKLDVNRDWESAQYCANAASENIYSICDWSPELSGKKQAKSNIGGNTIKDVMRIKQSGIIPKFQKKFESFWQTPLYMALEYAGNIGFGEAYNIKFEDKIESLVESLGDVVEQLEEEIEDGNKAIEGND